MLKEKSFYQICPTSHPDPTLFALSGVEYFEKKNALVDDVPSQIKVFVEFCEKWSINSLHSYIRVKLEAEKKGPEKQKNSVVFIHGWRGDEDSFGKIPTYVSKSTSELR